jgi:hypothetical protein
MEVEQDDASIFLHLNKYIQEILEEYKSTIKKFLKPKQVQIQPRVVLEHDDCPETPCARGWLCAKALVSYLATHIVSLNQ